MKYKYLHEIKLLEGNPRIIKDDQFEKLKQSIASNPDYFEARPILLSDRTGELVIIGGNMRYRAASDLGMKQVPTYLIKGLTEAKEREIIIRDNVSNGDWDYEALANAWEAEELIEWGVELPIAIAMEAINDEPVSIKHNFIIKCYNAEDLADLQQRFFTAATEIDYKDAITCLK